MSVYWETRAASLVAGGGAIWVVYAATAHFTNLATLLLPRGPLETCAIGILIWLHAKWRNSVQLR